MNLFQRLHLYRKTKKALQSDGVKVSQSYQVIINNDVTEIFDDYRQCLDFIDKYRAGNAIFNLSLFRIEFYSLISEFNKMV